LVTEFTELQKTAFGRLGSKLAHRRDAHRNEKQKRQAL
jgi:hypothetical protein